ncbi:hypothetical protein E2C01_067491 [Portunus trituberculatus]|uniref:Uncharacterized protein n=1 Tax=Portunus trituberculatus TaxID=210409 RepID=A0A5B7HSS1_PORTR|nr:hypothetical protein [Portunus trituberculatus]
MNVGWTYSASSLLILKRVTREKQESSDTSNSQNVQDAETKERLKNTDRRRGGRTGLGGGNVELTENRNSRNESQNKGRRKERRVE